MTTVAPAGEWPLQLGSASVFPANLSGLTAPFILLGDSGKAAVDPAVFVGELDSPQYSFTAALKKAGRDLILVSPGTSDTLDRVSHESLRQVIGRAIAQRMGDAPLVVCGIGRGALQLRYTLASCEHERIDHQVDYFISYCSTTPTAAETSALNKVGSWPVRPIKLEVAAPGVTFDLKNSNFDDIIVGAAANRNPLFTKELGTDIIDSSCRQHIARHHPGMRWFAHARCLSGPTSGPPQRAGQC